MLPISSLRYFLSLVLLILTALDTTATPTTPLYFTNRSMIDRLQDNVAVPVINAGSLPQSLDCNSCDSRIYWTSQNAIRRSFPNDSQIETILGESLNDPRGVAIDWRGNNVYFTDQRLQNGRLGVVSCDGSYQRIFTLLDHVQDTGPIAVDSLRGYMYYADVYCCIWRARLDGSEPKKIVPIVTSKIQDITIDYENSLLYWIEQGNIYRSDLSGNNITQFTVLNSFSPTSISISNGTLFWTQKDVNGNGSIYSYSLISNITTAVLQMTSLDPGDISSLIPKSIMHSVTGGCSLNNGGCEKFCFTLPHPNNPFSVSSEHTCACPTGFKLLADNTSCNLVPEAFVLSAQNNKINILSLDIPGEDTLVLPLPVNTTGTIEYISYDRRNEFLYWSQESPPAIVRSKIDGSKHKVIVSESIALPVGVAISDDGSTLFWADSALNKIEAVSIGDNGVYKRRVIVDTGLDHPQGIVINEKLGYLYWTDSGLNPNLKRSRLDGTEETVLVDTSIIFPGPITVRSSTDDIYWSERHKDNRAIWKIDKNGGNKEKLLDLQNVIISGLSFLGDTLYMSDRTNGQIRRLDVTASLGTSPTTVADNLNGIRGVVAINDTTAIENHGCLYLNGGCSDICVPGGGVNSSSVCICQMHRSLETNNKTCINSSGSFAKLMIATKDTVYLSSADATPPFYTPTEFNLQIPVFVRSMDFDYSNNKLYWISSQDGYIYRGDIPAVTPANSSSYPTELLFQDYGGFITDLAVDWWGRNLYWTNNQTGTVYVAKLSGKNHQILADDVDNPSHIVLDPYLSNLYITTSDGIQYLPMSGGTVNTLWTKPNSNKPILSLTIDISEHYLFWTYNNCAYEYRLLDSTNPITVWCDFHYNGQGTPPPTLLNYYDNRLFVLLPTVNEIYHIDEHASEGSNDGLHINIRLWGLWIHGLSDSDTLTGSNITSFKFYHYSIQPDSHWCTRTNGECNGDDTLCLVDDHYYFKCGCPSNTFRTVVYDEDRDVCRTQCNNIASFILFSTPNDIFHLPIRDTALAQQEAAVSQHGCSDARLQPQKLHIGILTDVKSIAYDPVFERVQWMDSNTLNSANVDGTARHKWLTYSYPLHPRIVVYDWIGSQLIWTDSLVDQIEIARFSTTHRMGYSGVLLEQSKTLSPVALAMDTVRRNLYFSDSYSYQLKSIYMGSPGFFPSIVHVPNRTKLNILYMSFEPNYRRLYWYDDISKAIEVYSVDSGDVTTLLVGIADASNVTAMTAVTFSNVPLLFWYNQSDWSIYFYNTSSHSSSVYIKLPNGTQITSLASHDQKDFKNPIVDHIPSTSCLLSPCTHICITTSFDFSPSCACPQYRILTNDSSTCSDLLCGGNLLPCGNESMCIPSSWKCDGVYDCSDQSDESNCKCQLGTYQCSDNNRCINTTSLCNELPNCDNGEDETNCTKCNKRCYRRSTSVYDCIEDSWICDGMEDCIDGSDETSCSSSISTPSSSSSPPSTMPSSTPTIILRMDVPVAAIVIATSITVIVMILVTLCVVGVVLQCIISKNRIVTHSSRYDFPTSSIKSSTSPQPNAQSINTSDLSINTIETGSTHLDKSSREAQFKRLSTISTDPSNPPNSPISARRSVTFMGHGDELSVISRPFSEIEHQIPAVPNPSMNYDAISDNISSVSQPRLLYPPNGGIISRFHDHPPPPYHQTELSFIDEDDDILFDDHGPYESIPAPPPIPLSNMDNISESTISLTTFNEEQCTNFMSREVAPGSLPHNYYDCPPPPSPVTEYSLR